jgi:hypothetical protein
MMMKILLCIFLTAFSSGCGYLNILFCKEHCGWEFVAQKVNHVSSVHKFGNLSAESISIGMTADEVIKAWGKPDRWLDPERQEWIYSNQNKLHVEQALMYKVSFRNNIVKEIKETYLKKEYKCRTNDL